MQQLHCISCNSTDNAQMFPHHSSNVLISSIDIAMDITPLKTISNLQISTHSIATMPTKRTGELLLHHVYLRWKVI